jgi:hypothetical protein
VKARVIGVETREQALARIRAKGHRIEAAFAAIDALEDDEAELVYVRLEARLIGAPARKSVASAPQDTPIKAAPAKTVDASESIANPRKCGFCREVGHRTERCEARKAAELAGTLPPQKKPKRPAGPNHSALAREVLAANPQGLRLDEIARKIGQRPASAFSTLRLLKRLGYAEQHGEHIGALWTVAGGTPTPRIETVHAAIVDILKREDGPADAWALHDEVAEIIAEETRKRPKRTSITRELSKLMAEGIVTTDGLNEHGPMYRLAKRGTDVAPLN